MTFPCRRLSRGFRNHEEKRKFSIFQGVPAYQLRCKIYTRFSQIRRPPWHVCKIKINNSEERSCCVKSTKKHIKLAVEELKARA